MGDCEDFDVTADRKCDSLGSDGSRVRGVGSRFNFSGSVFGERRAPSEVVDLAEQCSRSPPVKSDGGAPYSFSGRDGGGIFPEISRSGGFHGDKGKVSGLGNFGY